jgi:hypothetical protein
MSRTIERLEAENKRLRALVAEARAMFEWLSVAESHELRWFPNYAAGAQSRRQSLCCAGTVGAS